MGIYNFEGETFLAFIDISGFKHLMKNKEKIAETVYKFYQCGYNTLNKHRYGPNRELARIQGIFVSDCGIIFVNEDHEDLNQNLEVKRESLNLLLGVIKELNAGMIENNTVLTSSIAYGSLNCTEKLEFNGISKNPFYGDAYLHAFMDNENPQIKILPSECRIVKKNLPENLINKESRKKYEHFKFLQQKQNKPEHYYFYWMVNKRSKIREFTRSYSNLEEEKYKRMTKLIKKYCNSANN